MRCWTKPVRPSSSGFKAKISRYFAIKAVSWVNWGPSRVEEVRSKSAVSSSSEGGVGVTEASTMSMTDIEPAEGVKNSHS